MADDLQASMFDRLAHDLRGPLTPLRTATFLLRRGDLEPARQRELLAIIDRQTARLGGMVQEVADWQSAARGRLRSQEDVTELAVLVGLACESMSPCGGVEVELGDALANACIAGDAQRLAQMLATLLAFARARADDPAIRVSGRFDGDDAMLAIGLGYSSGAPTRVGDGLFAGPEGTPFDDGLGWRLMIADAIARAHGGKLLVEAPGDDLAGRQAVQRLCVRLPVLRTT
jgi:K+-sensing histidine kinase KdpD